LGMPCWNSAFALLLSKSLADFSQIQAKIIKVLSSKHTKHDNAEPVESQLSCLIHLFTVGSVPVSFTANRDISVHDWSCVLRFPSSSCFCATLNSAIN
jgi:hypothetical protein